MYSEWPYVFDNSDYDFTCDNCGYPMSRYFGERSYKRITIVICDNHYCKEGYTITENGDYIPWPIEDPLLFLE